MRCSRGSTPASSYTKSQWETCKSKALTDLPPKVIRKAQGHRRSLWYCCGHLNVVVVVSVKYGIVKKPLWPGYPNNTAVCYWVWSITTLVGLEVMWLYPLERNINLDQIRNPERKSQGVAVGMGTISTREVVLQWFPKICLPYVISSRWLVRWLAGQYPPPQFQQIFGMGLDLTASVCANEFWQRNLQNWETGRLERELLVTMQPPVSVEWNHMPSIINMNSP